MRGPKPSPNAPNSRHGPARSGKKELIELPLEHGYPIPDMPDDVEWSEYQQRRWAELWESPQAAMWDYSAVESVANLLIFNSLVRSGDASGWVAQEARQISDALGLTPAGMLRLGWKLPKDE